MKNLLSIRSYTNKVRCHLHSYHQLVLPLNGSINITVDGCHGLVSLGDCVVIKSGQEHEFNANELAKFIVADLDSLPANILAAQYSIFSINPPLLAYIQFIEKQLHHHINPTIEEASLGLFYQLLAEQHCTYKIDPRIEKVLAELHADLTRKWALAELSSLACLSLTQFKTVFQQSMAVTPYQYLTKLRMEKAKAMLVHTDLPVSLIAGRIGYEDVSAFSRRFSAFYGLSPSAFLKSH